MSDVAKHLEKAEKFLQKGKPEAALEEYFAALRLDPSSESIQQSTVDLCLTVGRTEDAAHIVSELFEHQAAHNDAARAAASYKKLARIGAPTTDQTFRYAVLIEKSNRRDALDAFEAVYKAFIARNRKEDALSTLKRLVALDPSPENLRREGDLASELGDTKLASASYVQLGVSLEKSDKNPAEAYEKAYLSDPTNPGAALGHGRCLVKEGDYKSAIKLLEPLANYPSAPVEAREAYCAALVATNRLVEAEPYLWEMYERNPKVLPTICQLIGSLVESNNVERALAIAHRLEEHHRRAGMRREFINQMKEVGEQHQNNPAFLEYLVELYNSSNREHDYCAALLQLFELYYAAGNFIKAADCLDRAGEVDPYEPGHNKRLEMLRGKVEANRWNALAGRFSGVLKTEAVPEKEEAHDGESTVLEDLMLQAEIFLQYSMRSKAVERLERIFKLFPREEEKSEKLRQLYLSAGFMPKYAGEPVAPSPVVAPHGVQSAAPPVPAAVANENSVDNISRVTSITRNIYRQSNVKGVLFTAVNDVGRHWNADRCVAGLCSPGKQPSAAMEYCAPGVKQSDVMGIVKLITTVQQLCLQRGSVTINNAQHTPELASIRSFVVALGIDSLLAVPLADAEEHQGVLILEQCNSHREWRDTDRMVLRTIADQTVLAVNNARLRSLVKTLAVTDEKSGLLKRSSYLDVLLSEVQRSIQQKAPTTLLLMEFGKASALVREFGEATVERFMQEIGQMITSNIRQNDVAVRYDLTQIAVILSDTNDKNAFFAADKLRKSLEGIHLPGRSGPLAVTSGIAEAVLNPGYDAVDVVTEAINRVEWALDAARADGGNVARSLAAGSLPTAATA